MTNISKQLEKLNKRENSLKQQMKQMKQQKAQLHNKKKKQYEQEKEKIIKQYIKKFDKLGMQVDLELDPMVVLISSIDNDSEYDGACYLAETLTKENLDKLLAKIKIAQHIEKHSEFKLVSTNDEIKMKLNEHYTRYELTIDKIDNKYIGIITKEREEDIEGEYVRQVKPQLFVDIEPFGYDGFYITWKHEVVGTSRTIGTSIKKALDVLRNIQ